VRLCGTKSVGLKPLSLRHDSRRSRDDLRGREVAERRDGYRLRDREPEAVQVRQARDVALRLENPEQAVRDVRRADLCRLRDLSHAGERYLSGSQARAPRLASEARIVSDAPVLLLAASRCDQCLTTRNRIVSGQRAAQLVRDCRRSDVHFVCHKGSAAGQIIHCRGVHDITGGAQAFRFAVAVGIEVREVDPDALCKPE
jgi:hypothetical protein